MVFELTGAELILAFLVITAGSIIQGSVGFGLALIAGTPAQRCWRSRHSLQ